MPYSSLNLSRNPSVKEIRVLRLTGNPHIDGPIAGNLRVISLSERDVPKFAALSYVWGKFSSPTHKIRCNGVDVDVTGNCMAALLQLRKNYGSIDIWVDAICINQADDAEKLVQLPLMKEVYSSAEVVYVWLGSSTETTKATDQAMDFLAKGLDIFGPPMDTEFNGTPSRHTSWQILIFQFVLWRLPLRSGPHHKGLDVIFSRAWITRLWTLQEGVLAKQMTVLFGEKAVPWRAMCYSLELMDVCCKATPDFKFPDSATHWRRLQLLWKQSRSLSAGPITSAELKEIAELAVLGRACQHQLMKLELELYKVYVHRAWRYSLVAGALLATFLKLCLPGIFLLSYYLGFRPVWFQELGDIVKFLWLPYYILVLVESHLGKRALSNHFYPHSPHTSLLLEIERRQSQDPKDKYNGVFGITHLWQAARVEDDCDILYQMLFVAILHQSGDPNLLLFAHKCKISGTPSWVINWDKKNASSGRWLGVHEQQDARKPQPSPWVTAQYYPGENTEKGFTMEQYAGATPKSPLAWEWSSENPPHSALVLGQIIGRIDYSSGELAQFSTSSPTDALEKGVSAVLNSLPSGLSKKELHHTAKGLSMLRACRPEYIGDQGIDRWCDIIHQGSGEGAEWTQEELLSQRETSRRSIPWRVREIIKRLSGPYRNRYYFPVLTAWLGVVDALEFHTSLLEYLSAEGMALVRCAGKHSEAGVAPDDTMQGDMVVLLSGVSLPIILRPVNQGFEIVGPAFFRNVMLGHLWTSTNTQERIKLV